MSAAQSPPGSRGPLRVVQLAVIAVSLAVWFLGTRNLPSDGIPDTGLISILPLPAIAAAALLGVCVGWLLVTGAGRWLTGATLLVFVVVTHALGAVVESEPAFIPTWVHMGFAEQVITNGRFAPELDARFNWPGFFAYAAFVSETTGIDLRTMALLSNGLFALLDLLALAAIVRSLTRDRAILWLTLLLFTLANWIGQEYFSPQALAYFLYLAFVALILTWFRRPGPRPGALGSAPPRLSMPGQRAGLLIVATLIAMAIVASHPLTPFVIIAGLGALTLVRRLAVPTMTLAVALMTVGWISYVAWPFVSGHFFELLAGLGELTSNVGSNVSGRVVGSPGHQSVVFFRLAYSGLLVALAGLWLLLRWRSGHRDVVPAVLLIAPFPLVGLSAYGGELVLRTYLFALPWIAVLLAAGLASLVGRLGGWRGLVPVAAIVCLMTPAFIVARYGNERLDLMRPTEVEGVRILYSLAPRGSVLVGPTGNLPWRYRDVTTYEYVSELEVAGDAGDLQRLLAIVAREAHPAAFLILTRSEAAFAEVLLGVPSSTWTNFESRVAESGLFELVYSNADAAIYQLRQ